MIDQFMSAKEVVAYTGITLPTLKRWVKLGKFPAPLQLGEATVRWSQQDVAKFIASKGGKLMDTKAEVKALRSKLAKVGDVVECLSIDTEDDLERILDRLHEIDKKIKDILWRIHCLEERVGFTY